MKAERRARALFWMTIGVVLFSILLVSGEAFGADCANCKQRVDSSWDCKRPATGLNVGGWRAARGKAPIFQKAHPAVCRVFVDRGEFRCSGSGVLIWRGTKKAAILTVHHLFREKSNRVWVVFPNGEEYDVERVYSEEAPDLGVLVIPRPDVEPITISEDSPIEPGNSVVLHGYTGKEGHYNAMSGRVVGYGTHKLPDGTYTKRTDLVITGVALDGNSGGPILNTRGELVAITWGGGGKDRTSHGSYAGRIGTFLTSQKFVAPWGDTDKIAPWNAKTEREKIRASAGAYAPNSLPLGPVAPAGGSGVDLTARSMAQDALNRVDVLSKEVSQAHGVVVGATEKAEEALDKMEESIGVLETGLLGKLKGYVFKLVGSWGLGGGLLATGVAGILFFLVRRLGIKMAQGLDRVTDFIPGTLDDRLLDPLAYKIGAVLSGKPIPEYAHTPGLDPWGRPYPGQQQAATAQQSAASSPTVVELQAQIDALKATK